MGMFYDRDVREPRYSVVVITITIAFIACIGLLMAILPTYGVWQRELAGKAQLKQADWNRQIAVREAQAEKESAQLIADSEIIRAQGIAEANRIIGSSITEQYLKYKFIEGLNDGNTEVIYVPTEANLPILEATR